MEPFIDPVYQLENVEQMRAIADGLRLRLVSALAARAMTVTQLGEMLDVPANKVHYHVRELERVGLVRLVETREKSGILEKYYRGVAHSLSVPPALLQSLPPDESLASVNDFLHLITQEFSRALAHALRAQPESNEPLTLNGNTLWLTRDELKKIMEQIATLVEPYETPRGGQGEREVTVVQLAYDALAATAGAESATPEGETTPPRSQAPELPVTPPRRPLNSILVSVTDDGENEQPATAAPRPRTWAAGVMIYSRSELERIVARGERLDITLLGYCRFARDIPAELADRAIARFHHRGRLDASPDVRAVLKSKEV